MDNFKHLLMLLDSSSITKQWGMTKIRPLSKNRGLMFWVNCTRFNGLIKIRFNDLTSNYNITYIPSGRGEVIEQKNIAEQDLINMMSKEIGQSTIFLDYLFDLYLM